MARKQANSEESECAAKVKREHMADKQLGGRPFGSRAIMYRKKGAASAFERRAAKSDAQGFKVAHARTSANNFDGRILLTRDQSSARCTRAVSRLTIVKGWR